MRKIANAIRVKSKIIAVLAAFVMLMAIGITYALLNSRTEVVANNFAGAAVNIGVVEKNNDATVVYEDMGTTKKDMQYARTGNGGNTNSDYMRFTDNERIKKKEVSVKNINSKDYPTTDTFVRVRLVPEFVYDYDNEENLNAGIAGEIVPMDLSGKISYVYDDIKEEKVDGKLNGCWKSKEVTVGNSTELYYYYTTAIAPDETTGNLIKEVIYNGDIPKNAHLELVVLSEGISSKQPDSIRLWNVSVDDNGNLTGLDNLN